MMLLRLPTYYHLSRNLFLPSSNLWLPYSPRDIPSRGVLCKTCGHPDIRTYETQEDKSQRLPGGRPVHGGVCREGRPGCLVSSLDSLVCWELSGTKQSECRKPGFHKQTDAKLRPVFRSVAKLCFLLGVDFRAVLYRQDLNQVYPPQTRPGYRFLPHFLAPLLSSEDTTKGALLISGLPVTSLGTKDTDPVTSVPRNRPEALKLEGSRELESGGDKQMVNNEKAKDTSNLRTLKNEQCGEGCGEKGGFGDERTQVEEKENQVFAAAAKPVCAADDTAPPGKPGPLLGARKVGLGSRQKWAHRNRY
ncbi:hypothetical protein E5288_WYG008020 [Bos mutus]|uniref:Uncharacterized protein n=1 Tax=Bos mutus TaxID=72004 RepID=A0A6B0RTC5_9CETA|nr:hypothetical protein [Bos mutus]